MTVYDLPQGKAVLRFSPDVKLFDELLQLHLEYHGYELAVVGTLPIYVMLCHPNLLWVTDRNKDPIYKVIYGFNVTSIEQLKEMSKELDYFNVEGAWQRFFPESTFLTDLIARCSQSNVPPYPVDKFNGECWLARESTAAEMLLFDSTGTSWAGPFTDNEGKLYCYAKLAPNKVEPGYEKSWRVYLAGNDDCSYTKYFDTEEESDAELQWLRDHQPLNMRFDVYMRGYEFTN